MLSQLSSSQLSEWMAYDELDPVGSWAEDFRFARLSSLISNFVLKIYGKKGAKEFTPEDFMPDWGGRRSNKPMQTVEEMKRIMMGIADASRKKKRKSTKIVSRKAMKKATTTKGRRV